MIMALHIAPFAHTGEETIPQPVQRANQYLHSKNVWHMFTRNLEAKSCRDAANKRNRLGHIGISLNDELKSFLGRYEDQQGNTRLGLVHCRGNAQIDLDKVRKVLGIDGHFQRLDDSEIAELAVSFNLDYGLVNPFQWGNGFNNLPVIQIFDIQTQQDRGLPHTMMTNAGDFTWGVEFNCRELAQALPENEVLIADVALHKDIIQPQYTPIGIITGNSPDSGIEFWQQINSKIQTRYKHYFNGDLSYPPVFVQSLPGMGLSMELDAREPQVWNIIAPAVKNLCEQGAKIITLACNTTPYFAPQIREICEQYGAKFISIADAVKHHLQEHNIHEVALVGISYVMDFERFSAYKILEDVAEVQRISEPAQQKIHDLAYLVKKEGANNAGLQRLRDIIRQETSAQHVVIALTELSVLLASQKKPGKSQRILLDALEIYSQHIADTYLTLAQPRELFENMDTE